MSTPPVVVATELTKTYRRGPEQVHALSDVSFSLEPGELVALVGPSGSGKTTLLNLLCGWEEPDSGEILWQGRRVEPGGLGWHELSIIPQSVGLVEELSLAENAALPPRFRSSQGPGVDRVRTLLDSLGLSDVAERVPEEVSLGEQQRAALARALIASPALVLADEPTGHQDSVWAHGVMGTLLGACERGACCLVATHNLEVIRYAHRILRMRDGHLGELQDAPASIRPPLDRGV